MKAMHSKCVEPGVEANIWKALNINLDDYKDKLNLACGADYKEGWINQDFDVRVKADVFINLENVGLYDGTENIGLPFVDGLFDLIYACHILEHIRNLQELKAEIYRILKPGGVLACVVPHYLSPDAWGNPQHIRAFSTDSFHISQFWPGDYLPYMDLMYLNLKSEDGSYEVKWIISKRTKVK
jgi:SAM-dependent methyltransferase